MREIAEIAARTLVSRGVVDLESTRNPIAETLAAPPMSEPSGPHAMLVGPETLDPASLPVLATARGDAQGAGDLVVQGLLGEGGMGVVELARQRSLQRDVAIKRARGGGDPVQRAALLREATFTGCLEHPSIVPVHALGTDGEQPIMVMKRIEGASLRAIARDPTHPAWAAADGDRVGFLIGVMGRVCDALELAHRRGVVHRDVKLDNVMVGELGEVYLLDWGVASRVGERHPPDAIAGTPAYMAPEMLTPETGEIDARTDVYLVGATLHDALVGKPRHAGDSLVAVMLSALESAPYDYGDAVPVELASVLARATHRDRDRRYASAAELKRALLGFLRHRAASELTEVAMQKLAEMERLLALEPREVGAIQAAYHACAFAFEHALREWPESDSARSGALRARELLCTLELATGNRAGAAALIAAMRSPPPALVSGLAELDARLAREAQERESLRALRRDLDTGVSAPQRRRALFIIAGVIILGVLGVAVLVLSGVVQPGTRMLAAITVPFGLIVLGSMVVLRRTLFANRATERIGAMVGALVGTVLLHRLFGVMRGATLVDLTTGDAMIGAACSIIAGATYQRVYFVPAAIFTLVSLAVPYSPYPLAVVGAGLVGSLLALALLPSGDVPDGTNASARSHSTPPAVGHDQREQRERERAER